jgi:hypothetical protein
MRKGDNYLDTHQFRVSTTTMQKLEKLGNGNISFINIYVMFPFIVFGKILLNKWEVSAFPAE